MFPLEKGAPIATIESRIMPPRRHWLHQPLHRFLIDDPFFLSKKAEEFLQGGFQLLGRGGIPDLPFPPLFEMGVDHPSGYLIQILDVGIVAEEIDEELNNGGMFVGRPLGKLLKKMLVEFLIQGFQMFPEGGPLLFSLFQKL